MARHEQQLAAIATMPTEQLRDEWQKAFGEPAPPIAVDLIARALAFRIQERSHGGLPTTARRHIDRLVRQLEASGEVATEREAVLKAGTRLARDWHGRTHHVLVMDDGFLFEDRRYRSLTQIANTITGAKWSGPRFFGLKRRPKAFSAVREVAHG